MEHQRKAVLGGNWITLYQHPDTGHWTIEDHVFGDTVSYDTPEAAKADYDRITDVATLADIFGWEP